MTLRVSVVALAVRLHHRHGKQAAKVQALCLPVRQAGFGVQQVGTADQLVEAADAQLRHDLAGFFRDEEEVVHHMLRFAGKLFAQLGVLRGHAHRAGVQVALAHHDAALNHQRCSGKAEFIGTQQGTHHHVTASLDLAVGLQAHTAAQAVEHEGLLGFGQADFPGRPGMLDGRPGRSARAAVVPGDHDVVGLALGHAGSNGAHPDFGHQLHGDVGMRGHVFQVVDELGQVLNGVDVVVRRGRNEAHARHAVAQLADVIGHLATGQLAAFAGLGTLRHLDLDLVGTDQVFGGHAEPARSHLLDLGAQAVAVGQRQIHLDHVFADDGSQRFALLDRDALQLVAVTGGVLAAFTGVALAANAVHGNGQRGVRFR